VTGAGPSVDPARCGGVEVEIGCGNGHFLAEYGARNPGKRLIGVELKGRRCRKAEEKAQKRGLGNVSIVHGAAEGFLKDLPPSTVDAFHLYFPDPWPKARHRKRRFLCRENLGLLHSRLKAGGRIFFGSDFFDYYIQAKVLVLLHGGFRLISDPVPEEAFVSIYSAKSSKQSKRVHLIAAVKLNGPA
jgi:tRNA (guanine-N7-)-methyltransferase